MESLYSKLHEKYTKLKARKFDELDKPNKEQEMTFMTYVTAAEELIEHLRSEKDRLSEQVNELRNEINMLRAKESEQSLEYQDLLMEDNQKIKELKEENERLLKLQREGLFSNTKDNDIPMLNASADNQNGSENTPMRPNTSTATTQKTITPSVAGASSIPANTGQSVKKPMSNQPSTDLWLPECCREINPSSDGRENKMESTNCVYQALIESLVGLKLSVSSQLHGLCISALHESSGYTFSLTWVYKPGKRETELLYKVISLGTLARIAPEWMREDIMFSINMCSLFFQRISRFIRLNQ